MQARPGCITEHEPLAQHTTFKIGGTADFFASIDSENKLSEVVAWARENEVPILVLGSGSNIVFADTGYRGLVIKLQFTNLTSQMDGEEVLCTVGAGVDWDHFVVYTVSKGWWGIENLSAIPGTVGAAPIQNIGAYGVEVKNHIDSVRVFDPKTSEFLDFSNNDCKFGYRDSIFKSPSGKGYIVTQVIFALSTTPQPVLSYADVRAVIEKEEPTQEQIRRIVCAIRARKFPDITKIGTAGSFFKNPIISKEVYERLLATYPDLPGYEAGDKIKVSAAWLIDRVAGMRGVRSGNVGSHEAQALVFVNYGGASAVELSNFADQVCEKVKQKTSIELEREVSFIS